jgi:ribosomal protein L10
VVEHRRSYNACHTSLLQRRSSLSTLTTSDPTRVRLSSLFALVLRELELTSPLFPPSFLSVHQIRQALRGKATILMGKNTMVRRALRTILAEYPQFEKLLPHVKGNIGFVFTSGDLKDVRDIVLSNKVAAPARAGALAPVDVFVPAGNTGMEPGKTSFFQALQIPTKIARGTIEIVSDVQVVAKNTRVGTSEATLLNMLNVSSPSPASLPLFHPFRSRSSVRFRSSLFLDLSVLVRNDHRPDLRQRSHLRSRHARH